MSEVLSQSKRIPNDHNGIIYFDFLPALAAKRDVMRYLEIGVFEGHLLSRIPTETAVGVDPNFQLKYDVTQTKKRVHLHRIGSDAFFADASAVLTIGGAPDLAFLDGLHVFEYLLRDFYNTESICNKRSLIAIHDCLPLSAGMAHRDSVESSKLTAGTKFAGAWAGDVWKLIPILHKYRPELKIVCVDAPPTGVVFVTGLDPSSTILRDRYLEIVREFHAIENGNENIAALYESIEIVPTENVLNNFDHSLFFVT